MFQQSCELYRHCMATIGAIKQGDDLPTRAGQGTLVAENRVLTARHVVRLIVDNGGGITVNLESGLWHASIVWEDQPYDLALLSLDILLNDYKKPLPIQFPQLSDKNPAFGMSVGLMAMHTTTVAGQIGAPNDSPLFAGGWVARREKAPMASERYSLTPAYVLQGFSGAGIFRPDTALIAVHVESIDTIADLEADGAAAAAQIHFLFPKVTPIAPRLEDIKDHC